MKEMDKAVPGFHHHQILVIFFIHPRPMPFDGNTHITTINDGSVNELGNYQVDHRAEDQQLKLLMVMLPAGVVIMIAIAFIAVVHTPFTSHHQNFRPMYYRWGGRQENNLIWIQYCRKSFGHICPYLST